MINHLITIHIPGQWQSQSPSVEVVPDNNVSFSTKHTDQTMDCPLHWRHVSTCYRVICAYCAYVTIRCTLGDTRCTPRHFVNKVSVRQFSAENKQESAEFYSKHLPMHSRDVIWKIKPKSTFPVSFSLVSAEMNLVGNYRTLRGLWTVNLEGLPSTSVTQECFDMYSPNFTHGCMHLDLVQNSIDFQNQQTNPLVNIQIIPNLWLTFHHLPKFAI